MFELLKEKLPTKNIMSSKTVFKIEGEIKTFPDKLPQCLFITTKLALQEMLKGVLQVETKGCNTGTQKHMKIHSSLVKIDI